MSILSVKVSVAAIMMSHKLGVFGGGILM